MEGGSLSRTALYIQLYEVLFRRIMDGHFPEGSYISNEYDLTKEFGVSIGTVRKAIDLLVKENLVIRQQGKGTVVSNRQIQAIDRKLNRLRFSSDKNYFDWKLKYFKINVELVPADISGKFDSVLGDKFYHLELFRQTDFDASDLQLIYFQTQLFPDIEVGEKEIKDLLAVANRCGHFIGRVEERVTAVAASGKTSELFSVAPGTPLLKTERLVFEKRGYALSFRISYAHLPEGYFFVSVE